MKKPVCTMLPITKSQAAYIAGIIDGEGCFVKQSSSKHSNKHSCYPLIQVVTTDKVLMEWMVNTTGIGSIYSAPRKQKNWSDAWSWNITSSYIRQILPLIAPYLIIKKNHADLFMRIFDIRNNRRLTSDEAKHFSEELSKLNKRGIGKFIAAGTEVVVDCKGASGKSKCIRDLSETESAYLAGIIDGEGCLGTSLRKMDRETSSRPVSCYLKIQISTTDKSLTDWILSTTGIGFIYKQKRGKYGWNDGWIWAATERYIRQLLPKISPYIVIKTKQLRLFESVIEIKRRRRLTKEESSLYSDELRKLNKRGRQSKTYSDA